MYLMSALGYVLILEQLAGRRVPRRRFVAVWGRSILGRYVPGNVLMVASRLVLGREAGIARRVSFAASVYEQALTSRRRGGRRGGPDRGLRCATVGPASWLVVVVPLGLVVLHPRLFEPLSRSCWSEWGRAPLEVLLSGRRLAALLAWYPWSPCCSRSAWARRALRGRRRRRARPLYVGLSSSPRS